MKILFNKFIVWFLIIIFWLFLTQFYYISASYKRDTNSYVTLIAWNWKLTSGGNFELLKVSDKKLLQNWDTVATIWESSVALIEWWDKSITRLAWNSKVLIKENFVWEDLSKINISFELLKWKTWSNVVTILSWDNHFKQEINGNVAAVRWTVFEANYDNSYIRVVDHEVSVTNPDWEQKSIKTWEVLSLKSFSFENLKIAVDKAWEDLNNTLDMEYYKNLQAQILQEFTSSNPFKIISNKIKAQFSEEYKVYDLAFNWDKQEINNYIWTLAEDKKQKLLAEFQKLSQTLNFEKWENTELYQAKLNSKDALIENTDNQEYKQALVKYSLYDLNSLLESNNINKEAIEKTANLLNNHQEIILNSKQSIENSIKNIDVVEKIKNLQNLENIDLNNLKNISNDLFNLPNKLFNLN